MKRGLVRAAISRASTHDRDKPRALYSVNAGFAACFRLRQNRSAPRAAKTAGLLGADGS
jgi:hypothetical protein